jgi:hypothetical protein
LSTAESTRRCENCGMKVDAAATICPRCGESMAPKPRKGTTSDKSATIATIASIIFPGLGHLYSGQRNRGLAFLIGGIVVAAFVFDVYRAPRRGGVTITTLSHEPPLFILGVVCYIAVWLYGIYDARGTARLATEGAF